MDQRDTTIVILITVLLVVGVIIVWHFAPKPQTPTLLVTATSTPALATLSLPGGNVMLSYPSGTYALAATTSEITVRTSIPPCDPNFDYCLFFNTSTYAGTNFESAGVRIKNRNDLRSPSACLSAQPSGFTGERPATATAPTYGASTFGPLETGAAGHIATDILYRLSTNGSCYEFDTRIGNSQFANYPSGSVQEFTAADRALISASLQSIITSITISPSDTPVIFPPTPASQQ